MVGLQRRVDMIRREYAISTIGWLGRLSRPIPRRMAKSEGGAGGLIPCLCIRKRGHWRAFAERGEAPVARQVRLDRALSDRTIALAYLRRSGVRGGQAR